MPYFQTPTGQMRSRNQEGMQRPGPGISLLDRQAVVLDFMSSRKVPG